MLISYEKIKLPFKWFSNDILQVLELVHIPSEQIQIQQSLTVEFVILHCFQNLSARIFQTLNFIEMSRSSELKSNRSIFLVRIVQIAQESLKTILSHFSSAIALVVDILGHTIHLKHPFNDLAM
jgi:glucose-6-phosphate isomerase